MGASCSSASHWSITCHPTQGSLQHRPIWWHSPLVVAQSPCGPYPHLCCHLALQGSALVLIAEFSEQIDEQASMNLHADRVHTSVQGQVVHATPAHLSGVSLICGAPPCHLGRDEEVATLGLHHTHIGEASGDIGGIIRDMLAWLCLVVQCPNVP